MADPEVKQPETEEKDPKKNPNILDADSDGKISSDELQKQLETADARNFTWKTSEGLKSYLEDKPKDKEAFKNMCEKILWDPSFKDKLKEGSDFKTKLEASPDRNQAMNKDSFTEQQRGYIALASLYLWLENVPKAETYGKVKSFFLSKDDQDMLVAPATWGDEVVLDGKAHEDEKVETKIESKDEKEVTKAKEDEIIDDTETKETVAKETEIKETATTTPEITEEWDGEEETEEEIKPSPSEKDEGFPNKETPNKIDLTLQQQEALNTQSTKFVDQHKAVNTRLDKLDALSQSTTKLYETSPQFAQHMRWFATSVVQDRAEAHTDVATKHATNRATISQNISNAVQTTADGKIVVATENIKNPDGSLNETSQVIREQLRAELTALKDNAQETATRLATDADKIAPQGSSERAELTQILTRFEWLKNEIYGLLTNIGSGEKWAPGEQDFVKVLENLNGKNMYAELFAGKLPEWSSDIADSYVIKNKTDALIGGIESNASTFGLSNTLKNGKLDDIRTSLAQFQNHAVAHEINGEIIYFNKDQLGNLKDIAVDDTGNIEDGQDQLLLDAKKSGKLWAWSVSELVKDVHDNKKNIFFPNEDGKDIRELGDSDQQAWLEWIADTPDTTMPENWEKKSFEEKDLAGKLDKNMDLAKSRDVLNGILSQPGFKRNSLGMEKPEQSTLNTLDFLKLNVGEETRYISTNDYLDLTKDAREESKKETKNIDENTSEESENTRLDYRTLAEQKYGLTWFDEDREAKTQGTVLTFKHKETDQQIGIDMKNTDAPLLKFWLDDKNISVTTSADQTEKAFGRVEDLQNKFQTLQEAYNDKDTKNTDQVFQLLFLQDHAGDLVTNKEMTIDNTTRTGIKDLPTWKQTLSIDNFIYDDTSNLLTYSASGEMKKEKTTPPSAPPTSKVKKTTTVE